MHRAIWLALIGAAAGIVLVTAGDVASGCEDDHPPIVNTPRMEFVAPEGGTGRRLSITVDPRGVGGVVLGDGGGDWIDPADSTGAWHYREWQWWRGHPWGDSCRPRYYADVELRTEHGRGAVIDYRIDGFECRQVFLAPVAAHADAPYWDVVTSIKNASGNDVQEYGQFFACYTPTNRKRSFWYWDESNALVLLAERQVNHLDGYVVGADAYFAADAIPHCPRGGGKIVGRWRRPLMASQVGPDGHRSVIMIEQVRAAAITQGISGNAMDYILYPGADARTLADQNGFSVHIRHVMLRSPELPTVEQLEALWQAFERSHTAVREQAAGFGGPSR